MEELFTQTKIVFEHLEEVEKRWKSNFEEFKLRIDRDFLAQNSIETPRPFKKKTKRLSVINDTDSELSTVSEANVTNQRNSTKTISQEIKTENTSTRPIRSARLKAENCYVEPSINSKLRQPSNLFNDSKLSRSNSLQIKKERISAEEQNKSNNNKKAKRKSSEDKETDLPPTEDIASAAKKVDESLLIVANANAAVVLVSDDEVEKMPPPNAVPKKKKTKKAKPSQEGVRSMRSRIKTEKKSLESSETDEIFSPEVVKSVIEDTTEDKVEDTTGSSKSKLGPVGKGKKGGKPFKHRPIKEEKLSGNKELVSDTVPADMGKDTEEKRESSESKNSERKNITAESVYEDAISNDVVSKSTTEEDVANENHDVASTSTTEENAANEKKLVVKLKKLKEPKPKVASPSPSKPTDATFVSAVDIPITTPVPVSDATFIAPATNKTILQNITHILATNNETFCLNNTESKPQNNIAAEEVVENSLLTEDNSSEDEYIPPPKVVNTTKSKKELFNPCVQSPVKKKVEAFEKHATALHCPQTRGQLISAKENKNPEGSKTPILRLAPKLSKYLTPTQSTTPLNGQLKKLGSTKSTQKISTSSSNLNKQKSLSQDNNTEDLKRGLSKVQLLAEEKKKKREQKQMLAMQMREAKEKERTEKLKKLMQEREEKTRRKQMEAEHKKQLEEIQKNIKLEEEKRDARLEKQKRMELDNLKIHKQKEALQQKLLQNEMLQKQKAKLADNKPKLSFGMLQSDDSTDDESKPSAKRPSPPSWSRLPARQLYIEKQGYLDCKVVDSFFSVKPMTPNLREIFPAIDPRYLKRNSSVVWNTPPRYSQLPKY